MKRTVNLFMSLLVGAGAEQMTCPLLQCGNQDISAPIVHDLCFQHDKKQPTESFVSHSCPWYEKYGYTQN